MKLLVHAIIYYSLVSLIFAKEANTICGRDQSVGGQSLEWIHGEVESFTGLNFLDEPHWDL